MPRNRGQPRLDQHSPRTQSAEELEGSTKAHRNDSNPKLVCIPTLSLSHYGGWISWALFFPRVMGNRRFVIVAIRAVHGSVRVGFVPNPEPTHRNWMRKKCIRRRPARVIGSDGSDHQQVVGGSVGVIDLRRQREKDEKTQIRRINADSGDSFPDFGEISLRSGKNLTGFDDISPDPVKISLDLR